MATSVRSLASTSPMARPRQLTKPSVKPRKTRHLRIDSPINQIRRGNKRCVLTDTTFVVPVTSQGASNTEHIGLMSGRLSKVRSRWFHFRDRDGPADGLGTSEFFKTTNVSNSTKNSKHPYRREASAHSFRPPSSNSSSIDTNRETILSPSEKCYPTPAGKRLTACKDVTAAPASWHNGAPQAGATFIRIENVASANGDVDGVLSNSTVPCPSLSFVNNCQLLERNEDEQRILATGRIRKY